MGDSIAAMTTAPLRIDAHQHFWDLERGGYAWPTAAEAAIHRTFRPADLAPELAAAGIDRTVLVQAADTLADTDVTLATPAANPFVAGVVGWVPLEDPAAAERELDARSGRLSGIRHLVHWEPDPDWILRPDVARGLDVVSRRGLPFDLVALFPRHLRLVPSLVARHPHLTIVIDHLAKPPFRSAGWDTWLAELRAAASASQRVHAKVSGLDTAAGEGWTVGELRPAVDAALEAFGPSRLLFGSDWPVCRLVSTYGDVVRATETLIADLSAVERARIMGGTAAEVYRLR